MLAHKPAVHDEERHKSAIAWCRRLGFYGFLFFLCKGLLWIFILIVLPYLGLRV